MCHDGVRDYSRALVCPNGMHPAFLVKQLEDVDCESRVPALLHEACLAAAQEHLKEALCKAGLQFALAGLLFSASCEKHELAQATLCSLWNLASPKELRAEVAQCSVAHALRDAILQLGASPDILEWSARVVWLLAEEPAASEVLAASNVAEATGKVLKHLT